MSVDYAYEIATLSPPREIAESISRLFGLSLESRRNHYVLFNDDAILWVDEQSDLGRELINEHLGLDTTVNVMGRPAATGREDPGMQLVGRVAELSIQERVGDFAFLVNGESTRLLQQDGETIVHDDAWWIAFWTPILRKAGVPFECRALPSL